MAAGLPVVAPAIPRLARILGPGHERLLYDARDPRGLADALAYAAGHEDERRRLGQAARHRACAEFSWAAHCGKLDDAIRQALRRRSR